MNIEVIQRYIPFLVPVIIIQLVLMTVALVDLVRREHVRGPKWLWVLIIVLGEYIGPIIYFIAGRKDE